MNSKKNISVHIELDKSINYQHLKPQILGLSNQLFTAFVDSGLVEFKDGKKELFLEKIKEREEAPESENVVQMNSQKSQPRKASEAKTSKSKARA